MHHRNAKILKFFLYLEAGWCSDVLQVDPSKDRSEASDDPNKILTFGIKTETP